MLPIDTYEYRTGVVEIYIALGGRFNLFNFVEGISLALKLAFI